MAAYQPKVPTKSLPRVYSSRCLVPREYTMHVLLYACPQSFGNPASPFCLAMPLGNTQADRWFTTKRHGSPSAEMDHSEAVSS